MAIFTMSDVGFCASDLDSGEDSTYEGEAECDADFFSECSNDC